MQQTMFPRYLLILALALLLMQKSKISCHPDGNEKTEGVPETTIDAETNDSITITEKEKENNGNGKSIIDDSVDSTKIFESNSNNFLESTDFDDKGSDKDFLGVISYSEIEATERDNVVVQTIGDMALASIDDTATKMLADNNPDPPPVGTELRFTMYTSSAGRGMTADIYFTQVEGGALRMYCDVSTQAGTEAAKYWPNEFQEENKEKKKKLEDMSVAINSCFSTCGDSCGGGSCATSCADSVGISRPNITDSNKVVFTEVLSAEKLAELNRCRQSCTSSCYTSCSNSCLNSLCMAVDGSVDQAVESAEENGETKAVPDTCITDCGKNCASICNDSLSNPPPPPSDATSMSHATGVQLPPKIGAERADEVTNNHINELNSRIERCTSSCASSCAGGCGCASRLGMNFHDLLAFLEITNNDVCPGNKKYTASKALHKNSFAEMITPWQKNLILERSSLSSSKNNDTVYERAATPCRNNMPHLYILKDTSCCTDPSLTQCASVEGKKLGYFEKTGK